VTYLADHQTTTRPGQDVRHEFGYLPSDGSDWGCCNFRGVVSTQLEYDSADYAIAAFAMSLGDTGTNRELAARAQDWHNVFHAGSGYMQARQMSGDWVPGFKLGTSLGFVEGTSATHTTMDPHNLAELIAGRGGEAAFRAFPRSLLSDITEPGREQASLRNEPGLLIPEEYDYVGQPWKTRPSSARRSSLPGRAGRRHPARPAICGRRRLHRTGDGDLRRRLVVHRRRQLHRPDPRLWRRPGHARQHNRGADAIPQHH
jgi:putative alpha-1,2-mannosidase